MTDKSCTTCSWWCDYNGKFECWNYAVDSIMPDGTCPEWEPIEEDTSVMVGQYVPNVWDEWKRRNDD